MSEPVCVSYQIVTRNIEGRCKLYNTFCPSHSDSVQMNVLCSHCNNTYCILSQNSQIFLVNKVAGRKENVQIKKYTFDSPVNLRMQNNSSYFIIGLLAWRVEDIIAIVSRLVLWLPDSKLFYSKGIEH